jgi:hypothetical protein
MPALDRVAQRFPLVARPRPPCLPLHERIEEVGKLARAVAKKPTLDRLPMAATAHNKAALIASDCGLPDLARSLCWRHAGAYLGTRPLPGRAARLALEPIVNLARLQIRGGNGDGAYRMLDTLYQAVRSRTDAHLDGRPVSRRILARSCADHRALCQWLWTVLLADGVRALAGAGHWDRAIAHAERNGGIGRRLLDGRQVAIIAHCLRGDTASALALLSDSAPDEPWEHAVAACLTVLCRTPNRLPADEAVAKIVEHYLRLEPAPGLLVFRTRLGLSLIDLAGGVEHPEAAKVATRLVTEAVKAQDGYAARDLLAHDEFSTKLLDTQKRKLSVIVDDAGLDGGPIPMNLMYDLQTAVNMSETAILRILTPWSGPARSSASYSDLGDEPVEADSGLSPSLG